MDTSIATTVGATLQTLPSETAERELALQRLAETWAAGEAFSALRSASARAREQNANDVLADVLAKATALWHRGDDPGHADSAAREPLRRVVTSPAFLTLVPGWIAELRHIASRRPGTGACTVATALQLWLWTVSHFQRAADRRDAVTLELAEAFCRLLAARCQILQVAQNGQTAPGAGQAGATVEAFLVDLCHVQAAQSAAAVATLCAELVFGYRRHPAWDVEGCSTCYGADDLDTLEGLIPGIASTARGCSDVIEADGSHPAKAGPCAGFDRLEQFTRLRARLDGCLTGARLSKERAAAALPRIVADELRIKN